MSSTRPPPPTHILETCLYVRDISASTTFYTDTLGLTPQMSNPRMAVYSLGNTTLILFQLGLTEKDTIIDGRGVVPGHGPNMEIVRDLMGSSETETGTTKGHDEGAGQVKATASRLHTHYCLAVSEPRQVDEWERYLNGKDVVVRGTMSWEKGGKSVYFEDPDGHVGEIGSRGIWEHW